MGWGVRSVAIPGDSPRASSQYHRTLVTSYTHSHTHTQIHSTFRVKRREGERPALPACSSIQVVYLRVVESILGCRVGVASSIATPSGTHER